MKENKIAIRISKPVEVVFEFTSNPANTAKWIKHIVIEESSEYPPKVNTIYRNRGESNIWDEYYVSEIVPNKIFELTSKDGTYQVRYTYTKINDNESEMEYFEWMNVGELSNPFPQSILEELKKVLEA